MAEGLLDYDYKIGFASVEHGSTAFTISGGAPDAWRGDILYLPSQPTWSDQRIKSFADGVGELEYPWPGDTAAEVPYSLRYIGIIERSTAQSRKVLEQLGDVKAWYDIIVEDDAARLALESASNPLPAGYRVLVRLDGVIWMKKTSSFGDWIGPVEFKGDTGNKGWSPAFGVVADGERRVLQLAEWVGGEGTAPAGAGKYVGAAGLVDDIAQAIDVRGEGFQWGGAYNAASAYGKGSVTRQNGSAFIAAQAVPPGEAPSNASPPVDTPYWAVLAAKGQDGNISGVTPFWQSRILNDADAAAALDGLGAQAALGYTPANKAGDTFTGQTGVTMLGDSHKFGIFRLLNPDGINRVTDFLVGKALDDRQSGKFGFYAHSDLTQAGSYIAAFGRNELTQSLFLRGDGKAFWQNSEIVTRNQFTENLAQNGWARLPNGLIVQWGRDGGTLSDPAITFPTAFPVTVAGVFATSNYAVGATSAIPVGCSNITNTGFTMRKRGVINGGTVTTETSSANWFAVGF